MSNAEEKLWDFLVNECGVVLINRKEYLDINKNDMKAIIKEFPCIIDSPNGEQKESHSDQVLKIFGVKE